MLLIACANFAMLLMARAVARQRELMIRASLGAKNSRLIRQRLTESTLLALVGGAVGLLVAKLGTMFLLALKPAALHRFHAIPIDARVFVFVFVISLLTGLLFGLLPAWSASRSDIAEALRANQRATGTVSRSLLRSVLITAEVALALILLAGAGLLIKGFLRLRSVNPGFNPANVMTMYLQLPATRYSQFQLQTNFRRELLARINALPGVEAAMITDIPLAGNYVGHRVVIDGRPTPAVGTEPEVQTLSVMGDYFRRDADSHPRRTRLPPHGPRRPATGRGGQRSLRARNICQARTRSDRVSTGPERAAQVDDNRRGRSRREAFRVEPAGGPRRLCSLQPE